MAEPTAQEQLMLELINRSRLNPNAEASRFGIALNEGVPTNNSISSTPKQPLAFNSMIADAAREHSQWMLNTDTFSHTGANGSDTGSRMQAAGYNFTGNWTWGENISWNGTTGAPDITQSVVDQHKNLFVDEGVTGRGHRVNLMNDNFREIGIGSITGQFTTGGTAYNSVMTTQDFGKSGDLPFFTGVVYSDNNSNKFYDVGEGLGGVNLLISGARATSNTSSLTAGGFQVQVPAGSYKMTFSGGGLSAPVTSKDVAIGSENIKIDLVKNSSGSVDIIDALTGTKLNDSGSDPLSPTNPIPPGQSISAPNPQTPQGTSTLNLPTERFWDFVTGSHFYTANPQEISDRRTNTTRYRDEGVEFIVPAAGTPGTQNVRRFLNTVSGTYFYTIDPASMDFVRRLPQFKDDGDAFAAYSTQVTGTIPLYRFANLDAESRDSRAITHFYTSDSANRQRVIDTLPNFRNENVGFYVFPS